MRRAVLACATAALALAPTAARAESWWERLYFRGGVARVALLEQSRELELADIDGGASLAVQNGPISGSGATISSATILAVTIGYRLKPLDGRLSLETIVGLPFTMTFRATGTLANESIAPMVLGIPTGVEALGPEMGKATVAPAVVTVVYQLLRRGPVRPYAGAGPALLITTNARVTNPLLTAAGEPDFKVAPAPGFVLQAGAEVKLWKNVYARLDVKFIAGMLARATVKHMQIRTPELPLFEPVEVGTAKMDVWVNPLIVQGGVGLDF
jgi:outer membrane protein W